MPSPYEVQRPTTMRASPASESSSSRARRDLPIPACRRSSRAGGERVRRRASNAARSCASSSPRPTNGVAIGRVNARHVGPQPDEPVGGERLALALASSGGAGSACTGSRDGRVGRRAEQHLARRRRLLEPGRDVDGVAGREPLVARPSPTITSPVLTPMRVTISTPCSRASSSLSSRARRRISAAARTARSASSSCTAGHAEDGHDRVADELLDGAAVPLEHRLHRARSSAASRGAAAPGRAARRAPWSRPRR